ncbi:MAG: U3 snoRNP protein [Candelina submexicana]|nr:MAG: U3 snoRNP protein [Candelina submexicana]
MGYITALSEHLDFSMVKVAPLVGALVENLKGASRELRSQSLRILDTIYTNGQHRRSETLATALLIAETPLELNNARIISMRVRKLASSYESAASDLWLKRVVPYFCFGLLTEQFTQLWHDSCDALAVISQIKEGEEIVAGVAFEWLQDLEVVNDSPSHSAEFHKSKTNSLTRFECSNLNEVQLLARQSIGQIADAHETLRVEFVRDSNSVPLSSPMKRSQALRVLSNIPKVAEKNSRQLVPILLDWATSRDHEAASATISEAASNPRNITNPRWCRKDQKGLLGLFAQFVNPTVLYKSTEVFRALLALLSNSDVDIQRSALKALFTWNSPSILPYKENLLNILDDARFREEISIFIHVDEEDSMMQQNHRQELMPILLRLLYGKIVAKGALTSGRSGQKPKRKAVLEALARFGPQELDEFTRIALGPLSKLQLFESGKLQDDILAAGPLSLRKQLGLVNMLEDMLETLGTRLHPFITSLLHPLLYCITGASRGLLSGKGRPAEESESVQVSLLKAIRQVGCKCLSFLFSCFPDFEWRPYMPTIFREIIDPRLERLSIETAQSVSGLLQLFSIWSTSYNTACFLVRYNKELLKKVSECLAVPSAKDEVKLFILDKILKRILELAVGTDYDEDSGHHGQAHVSVTSEILQPNLDSFLVRVGGLLRGSPTKDLLGAGVQVISQLGPFITRTSEAKNLVDISIFLLDQPSQRVSPKTKSELLRILQHFLPLYDIHSDQDLQSKVLRTVSSLFGYFKDRNSREVLSQVLTVYAQTQPELLQVAKLCIKLNAFSPRRLDEPDFDQRREAFNFINEDGYKTFSITQWRPILYNALFYIKDNEELAIRMDASETLRRLIESSEGHSTESDFIKELISPILLPSLRKGMHESSELVRKEYTDVVAHLVKHQPNWTEVSNMRSLLVEDHEEATFFENILHVQQPCRMRALRQLAKNVQKGLIQSNNISHLFIPLIEHFIFNKAEDEISNNLAAETINTIGILAEELEWQQFRAILRRYSSYMNTKPDLEKTVIKLLSSVIGGLGRAAETSQTSFGLPNGTTESTDNLSAQGQILVEAPSRRSTLALTIPKQDKLAEDLVKNLLPPLMGYLHNKDESTVSLRVPVAVSIVKLLKLLPSDQLCKHLPPVLTDVCHILRSKSQDARDMTRKTLAEIAALTGPSCFGFMLRELKGSLERGYQLHVLSFTVHSILVSTASIFKPGDIDYCLPQIVSIIRNDIFGDTGEEKDAEDYISKAKEVKSSKSYDSMELVARTAALSHLGSLVNPISELLQEKLTIKLMQKIDELLRRVMVGILRNDAVQDHRILKFCHEIIKAIYETKTITLGDQNKEERPTQRFLIDIKGAKGAGVHGGTTSYDYKMVQFALNLLRSVLQKHDHLKTSYYLTDFMPIIGNAMLSTHEDVQISALRLLTTIIKVPIPEIAKSAKVYIAESVKMIKGCSSTNTEIAQAALKLISAILRERLDVNTSAADINHIKYLLKRLKPDLSEPDRQGVTFNFLRAIITRKVNIPEIYEVIDTVAEIMVTNYSRGARDLARGAYFQFFMEYEQTQHRLSKQLGFLVQNLEYPYQEGRQSVLEALHLLLTKVPDAMTQEILGTVFIPLVMVLVNDESVSCREMATALLKEAFQRADGDRTQTFLSLLRTWLGKDEQSMLTRVALQCYSIYYEIRGSKGRKELPSVQTHLLRIMQGSIPGAESRDWEILYFALQLTASLCQHYPSKMMAPSSAMLWEAVVTCVSFPHAWVKVAAARLIGLYFADFARTNAESGLQSVPLEGSEGLQLNEDEMLRLTSTSLRVLRVPGVSEELATHTVRNLVFLGRCFGVNGLRWQKSGTAEGMDEFDEEIEEEVVDEVASAGRHKSALTYLFERLSAILRRESITTRAPSLVSKTASLQLLSTLCNNLPPSSLLDSLQTILLPLHNLTDPSIPSPYSTDEAFVTTYKALVSASHEIMELIKKKLGPSEYTSQMSRVRKGVKERREGRRIKRRIEAVATPEKLGREKKRKGEKKREKRKERSGEERSRRRGW